MIEKAKEIFVKLAKNSMRIRFPFYFDDEIEFCYVSYVDDNEIWLAKADHEYSSQVRAGTRIFDDMLDEAADFIISENSPEFELVMEEIENDDNHVLVRYAVIEEWNDIESHIEDTNCCSMKIVSEDEDLPENFVHRFLQYDVEKHEYSYIPLSPFHVMLRSYEIFKESAKIKNVNMNVFFPEFYFHDGLKVLIEKKYRFVAFDIHSKPYYGPTIDNEKEDERSVFRKLFALEIYYEDIETFTLDIGRHAQLAKAKKRELDIDDVTIDSIMQALEWAIRTS